MASILVNSLKRLYEGGKLTKEQIAERVEKGSISAGDFAYITGDEYEPGVTDQEPGPVEGEEDDA